MGAPETETFKYHYDRLRDIAERMRSQQEPDLDSLLGFVDQALESHTACKGRLAAIKLKLDERFGVEE